MVTKRKHDQTVAFERAATKRYAPQTFVLRLYVAGMDRASCRAIITVKQFCREHLQDRYDLKVIDLYRQPALAVRDQIIATPTLLKKEPQPKRIFVGNLSDPQRLLGGLGLDPRPNRPG